MVKWTITLAKDLMKKHNIDGISDVNSETLSKYARKIRAKLRREGTSIVDVLGSSKQESSIKSEKKASSKNKKERKSKKSKKAMLIPSKKYPKRFDKIKFPSDIIYFNKASEKPSETIILEGYVLDSTVRMHNQVHDVYLTKTSRIKLKLRYSVISVLDQKDALQVINTQAARRKKPLYVVAYELVSIIGENHPAKHVKWDEIRYDPGKNFILVGMKFPKGYIPSNKVPKRFESVKKEHEAFTLELINYGKLYQKYEFVQINSDSKSFKNCDLILNVKRAEIL